MYGMNTEADRRAANERLQQRYREAAEAHAAQRRFMAQLGQVLQFVGRGFATLGQQLQVQEEGLTLQNDVG